MMRVADYIANFLHEKNSKHVFMVTGGGAMHLNDAFGLSQLCCIFNNHEQACTIAAEAYFRVSNKPAVVNVTSGPGGTNAITGVYGAWVDSASMFVISGQVKRETTISQMNVGSLRQLGDQELDIVPMVKQITKYAAIVEDKQDIRYHLERAWFECTTGRPGPVWLDVPLDIQGASIEPQQLRGFSNLVHENIQEVKVLERQLSLVVEQLKNSKKPVFYIGTGVRLSATVDLLKDFCKKYSIPIVTAWNSNDLIADEHDCSVGRGGTVGNRSGNFALQNSDLLIVLGNRLNIRLISYNWENFSPNSLKVMVDIDEAELFKPTLKIDFPIKADLKDFVPLLSKEKLDKNFSDWLAHCKKLSLKYDALKESYVSPQAGFLNPYIFMRELSQHLKQGQVTVTGDGTACVASFQAMTIKNDQRLFTNSGCASMGYDLPAAIGAYYACGKPVVCLAGDGSIMMNVQELSVIQGRQLPILIFVINNSGYHSIRQTQNNYFKDSLVGFDSQTGVNLPNFEKMAEGFELNYKKINDYNLIKQVVDAFYHEPSPMLVEVFVDHNQEFVPKLSSKKLEDGTMISALPDDMFPFLSDAEMKGSKFDL